MILNEDYMYYLTDEVPDTEEDTVDVYDPEDEDDDDEDDESEEDDTEPEATE